MNRSPPSRPARNRHHRQRNAGRRGGQRHILAIASSSAAATIQPGTISLTLTAPNHTTTTQTVTFNGDGTYNATPVLATQVGTYTWSASYAGNTLNNSAHDNGQYESVTTVKAGPAISTTPGGAIVLGSGAKLTDSATLSGGFSETGTLNFTLYNSASASVYTTAVLVSGNGTYATAGFSCRPWQAPTNGLSRTTATAITSPSSVHGAANPKQSPPPR